MERQESAAEPRVTAETDGDTGSTGPDEPLQQVLRKEPMRSTSRPGLHVQEEDEDEEPCGTVGVTQQVNRQLHSSYSLCSIDKSDSHYSSSEHLTHHTSMGDDCAAVLLTCLFCRFYELFVMQPDTCESALNRCCPSYRQLCAATEPTHTNDDCNCSCEFDCSLFDACQETSECLELAMEMSEICYR